jgi:GntR family transcriptional repressor for pyruvate dehydrogenase complex
LDILESPGRKPPRPRRSLQIGVSRTTLSEQLYTQIAAMIAEGRWKPQEKIHSESDLCQLFQVGRSTVREALKALAMAGVVQMRHGDGTYVTEESSKVLDRIFRHGPAGTESINDLCEARSAMETHLASLCALRGTDEEFQSLEDLCREMEQCVRTPVERFHELDLEFHLAIGRISKSRVLVDLLKTIRELLRELIKKSQEVPGARELACTQHRRILGALKEHNPRKARSAIRNHLNVFQRRYNILLRLELKTGGLREHQESAHKSSPG